MTNGVHPDEAGLIARCRCGDERAMQLLFERHQQKIYAMALRLTGSVADAEDVLQDTFLRAFRHFKSFRGDSAVSTWLCRIAINLSRDWYRKKSRIPTMTGQENEPVHLDSLGSQPHPADTFAKKRLEAALAELPVGYREVLVMHDVMGMDHTEIAAVMGVKPGTSKSQLHKARAKMRELLTRSGKTS